MTFTPVITKNPGDTYPSAHFNTYVRDNLNKGVIRPLFETVLAATAAQIHFTAIPADFSHLLVAWHGRSTAAAINANMFVRFNSDATANYDYQNMTGTGTGTAAGQAQAVTAATIGQISASTALSNQYGSGLFIVPNYLNVTARKQAVGISFLAWAQSADSFRVMLAGLQWRVSNTPISELTLLPSSGDFAANSMVTMYGMGGI